MDASRTLSVAPVKVDTPDRRAVRPAIPPTPATGAERFSSCWLKADNGRLPRAKVLTFYLGSGADRLLWG